MSAEQQKLLPFVPWHEPKFQRIAPGVEVATAYGSHAIAAVLYGLWRVVVRREPFMVRTDLR